MTGKRDDTNGYSDNGHREHDGGGTPVDGFPRLTAGETKYPRKEMLYRSYNTIPPDQFEQLCIAEMEGDLSLSQLAEIETAVETNESLRRIRTLIQRTKLTTPTIRFTRKRVLKKTGVGQRIFTAGVYTAAAASVAALVITILMTSPPAATVVSEESGNVNQYMPLTIPISPATTLTAAIPDVISTAPPRAEMSAEELATKLPEISEETVAEITKTLLTSEEKAVPAILTLAEPLQMQMVYISYRDIDLADYGTATLRDNILIAFRQKVLGRDFPSAGPVKGYELAEVGVAGLNQLLGWEMSVNIESTGKGDINSLAFNSKLINFNRSYEIVEDTR